MVRLTNPLDPKLVALSWMNLLILSGKANDFGHPTEETPRSLGLFGKRNIALELFVLLDSIRKFMKGPLAWD